MRDTPLEVENVQLDLLRKMSIPERLDLVGQLNRTTRELSFAAIERTHPDLSDQEQRLLFVKLHYGTELADRVKEYLEARAV